MNLSELKKDSTDIKTYKQHYLQILHNLSGEKIYTDASKSQAGVGVSVIWNIIKLIYKLSNISSIFTAESFAILRGIQLAIDSNIPKATIFSDSLSVINNITNAYTTLTT